MEGVEDGGPIARIPLGSVDLVVVNSRVLGEEVVPSQDHKQRAGGKEGHQ